MGSTGRLYGSVTASFQSTDPPTIARCRTPMASLACRRSAPSPLFVMHTMWLFLPRSTTVRQLPTNTVSCATVSRYTSAVCACIPAMSLATKVLKPRSLGPPDRVHRKKAKRREAGPSDLIAGDHCVRYLAVELDSVVEQRVRDPIRRLQNNLVSNDNRAGHRAEAEAGSANRDNTGTVRVLDKMLLRTTVYPPVPFTAIPDAGKPWVFGPGLRTLLSIVTRPWDGKPPDSTP